MYKSYKFYKSILICITEWILPPEGWFCQKWSHLHTNILHNQPNSQYTRHLGSLDDSKIYGTIAIFLYGLLEKLSIYNLEVNGQPCIVVVVCDRFW